MSTISASAESMSDKPAAMNSSTSQSPSSPSNPTIVIEPGTPTDTTNSSSHGANAASSSSTRSTGGSASSTPPAQAPQTPSNAQATPSNAAPTTSNNINSNGTSSTGSTAPGPQDEEAVSFVNQEGEWKYRKINLFRVVRGFVSQLKPGQDLTKVSLPAECCTPYGLLEVMGSRELAMFHLTFGMNRHPNNPMERFFAALRFFFGTVRSERFDKKPWNPVLGETHITYADVIYGEDGIGLTETVAAPPPLATPSGKGKHAASTPSPSPSAAATSSSSNPNAPRSRTVFVGEQVSHHPPISAICLTNEREQLTCQANVSFSVKFGGNQVTVATAGGLQLISKKFNETYELTKCVPDMVVRNVVWGKKYIMWEGELTMTCPQTGLTAFLKFQEKSSQNVVKGYIMQGNSDEPLYKLHGVCGERIHIDTLTAGAVTESKVLLDLTTEPLARIRYLPRSKLAPLSSVGVWEAVNKAIVDDDITLADKEKKVIEQAQRERAKARAAAKHDFQGCYFDMGPDGMWTYKNNMDLDTTLAEGAKSIDPLEDSDNIPLDGGGDDIDDDGDEFISQEEDEEGAAGLIPEPLLAPSSSSTPSPQNSSSQNGSSAEHNGIIDRSPITSGDEGEEPDSDMPSTGSAHLQVTDAVKRRRGSSSAMGVSSKHSKSQLVTSSAGSLPSSASKKELRAEKKKAREEVKMAVTKMKEEKKKGTVFATLLEGQMHAGWAKVRNMMKQWKDRYLVLLPGRLVIFRSPSEAAKSNASGMVLLQGCDVRPRPSKKDGSCFKIFSLNQYPIYSRQGLKGESISSALLPVGADYCILRCLDAATMNAWIEKIRQCIPDWEKNKHLMKQAGVDIEDSESDEDSVEDSEFDTPMGNTSPLASSISSTSLGGNGGGSNVERLGSHAAASSSTPGTNNTTGAVTVSNHGAAGHASGNSISVEDLLNQLAQLYKITKRIATKQKKHMENMDEFRTKTWPEGLAELKRGVPSTAAAASSSNPSHLPRNPFDKHKSADASSKAPSTGGVLGKIRQQLDPKTIILLLIIAYLLYLVLTASSSNSASH